MIKINESVVIPLGIDLASLQIHLPYYPVLIMCKLSLISWNTAYLHSVNTFTCIISITICGRSSVRLILQVKKQRFKRLTKEFNLLAGNLNQDPNL